MPKMYFVVVTVLSNGDYSDVVHVCDSRAAARSFVCHYQDRFFSRLKILERMDMS